MLDRIGDEVGRATSIVRYAPKSRFSPHTHGGGEEFLVLDGVFQDERGDYPVGTYVRNPPGSRHKPGSEPGCTIFVKLWQFDPEDHTALRIETATLPFGSAPGQPGVEQVRLFENEAECVRLESWLPGSLLDAAVEGGIELLVLEGSFREAGEDFVTNSWLRLPAQSRLRAQAGSRGCKLWVKSGHLAQSMRLPDIPQ